MSFFRVPLLLLGASLFLAPLTASAGAIPTAPVGNPGNANDPGSGSVYGGVSYQYRIGETEVTNAQYAAFLNEKAKSDPLALYNTNMLSSSKGGISRNGVSGSYTYSTKPNMADKPVNYVNWYDSIRFANWLNNGQGAGDTESGAYTLLGGTPTPSNGLSIARNSGATWFLPSENEWYKSAYYQPVAHGGDVDGYWLYATQSNVDPTLAMANVIGDVSNPGANVANYNRGADWNSQDGNVTSVGSAGPLSQSFYGTSDQSGNVWEWNEGLISGTNRGLRGGSWVNVESYLHSSHRDFVFPTFEDSAVGFRVATVPEPSTLILAVLGGLALVGIDRRHRN